MRAFPSSVRHAVSAALIVALGIAVILVPVPAGAAGAPAGGAPPPRAGDAVQQAPLLEKQLTHVFERAQTASAIVAFGGRDGGAPGDAAASRPAELRRELAKRLDAAAELLAWDGGIFEDPESFSKLWWLFQP